MVGAGVIGCAVAWVLAREGHRVLLIDRGEPGMAGASFGNVGHIAAELIEPLPSPAMLFGFWKELFALGGPLSVPLRRLPQFLPWARRFGAAAFRREANTRHLAPLVRPASADYESALKAIGRPDLLRRNGHYQIWLGAKGVARARSEAAHMAHLEIPTQEAPADLLRAVGSAANAASLGGLWFPQSAHVVDPLEVCKSYAHAAMQRGAMFRRAEIRSMNPRGEEIELHTDAGPLAVRAAVICAGAWATPLLAPFGLKAPLEAARGYHVELPVHAAHVDAPIVYVNERMLVTPMSGRLRASTYMEFSGLDAPADPRKPARLLTRLRQLGYRCDDHGPSWFGPRPVLPDYLPGIGRAPSRPGLYYAIGHQHIGLTLAPVTAELIGDLVAGRDPRHDVAAFDLQRFGRG